MFIIVIIMIIPSILTAISVIDENNFHQNAVKFVKDNKTFGHSYIYDYSIDRDGRKNSIEVRLAGDPLSEVEKALLISSAGQYGIKNDQIAIIENGTAREDMSENELIQNILDRSESSLKEKNTIIDSLSAQLNALLAKQIDTKRITKELLAQYPDLTSLSIASGEKITAKELETSESVLLYVNFASEKSNSELKKIENWIKARLDTDNIIVLQK